MPICEFFVTMVIFDIVCVVLVFTRAVVDPNCIKYTKHHIVNYEFFVYEMPHFDKKLKRHFISNLMLFWLSLTV